MLSYVKKRKSHKKKSRSRVNRTKRNSSSSGLQSRKPKKSRSRVKKRKSKSLFKVTKSDLKLRSKKLSDKGKAEIVFEYTLSHKIPKSLKVPKLSKGWKVTGRGTHLKARSYNRDIFLEGPKSGLKQVKSKLRQWSRKNKLKSRIR